MNRYDKRSPSEFKKDIKVATEIEQGLMGDYVAWLNKTKGGDNPYSFKDYGCDNSGEFVQDKDVNLNADFLLCRKGFNDKKIEIKFCREDYDEFHLKLHQVTKYIKEDVCIVNYMGINTDKKRFCILTPGTLKQSVEKGPIVTKWSKPCIRYKCKDYTWVSNV